ncbi:hypothetical protein KGY79_11220 [Candidatus Bipolaricaulota bacterium]|nr:hypothetical protein [Candidatus Bipolaricaulota bacterium]
MRKVAITLTIFILLFGLVVVSTVAEEEVKVPFEAVKTSCYYYIDLSKAEYFLSEISKNCVKSSWLEANLSEEDTQAGEETNENKKINKNVKQLFYDVMGKTVNWKNKPETIKEFDLMHFLNVDGYSLSIRYRASDNSTKGLIKDGIYTDAMEFVKKLYNDPANSKILECHLYSYLMLEDQYDNESEEQVSKISLDREVAEEINWESISYQEFVKLVKSEGSFYLHPALK